MTFQLYMILCTTSGSLRLPHYITLIWQHGPQWRCGQHDSTWKCWYICAVTGVHVELQCCWVMDVLMVYHSFTSAWKIEQSLWWFFTHLMFLWHVSPCLYVGRLDRLICLWKVYVHLSMSTSYMFSHMFVCKNIFAWSFIHKNISSHASFVRPLVNMSLYMCSFHSFHSLSHHVCWCTCTYSHSWRDDIKSKKPLSLPL